MGGRLVIAFSRTRWTPGMDSLVAMWFRRKADPDTTDFRRVLFGNLPPEEWPPEGDAADYPWSLFSTAREAWRAGDKQSAVVAWRSIAHDSQLESRHNLQAWHFLRLAGVQPLVEEAAQLLGVMAEVAVGREHDLLVAYADGTARYLNHAGGVAVIDDVMLGGLSEAVQTWLGVGQRLAGIVGLWDKAILPPLPPGQTRILMLTPGGFRFGQGPDAALRSDPAGSDFLQAATRVLLVVTAHSAK